MNYNIDNNVQEYKECAGRDCKNHGKYKLKIKYIHKFGLFCNSCRQGLQKMDLIDTEELIIN
jgi:hypothetical protein